MPAPANTTEKAILLKPQTFNRFNETANRVLGGIGGVTGAGQLFHNGDHLALIRNSTGADIEVFNPVPLSGVVDHTFTDTATKTVGELVTTYLLDSKSSAINQDDFGRWGLAVEAIKAGELGRILLCGITFAEVNIKDIDDLYVDIFDDDILISASTGTARLLGKATATGAGYYPVHLGCGGGQLLIGTLDGDLAHDGTQTIDSSKATVHPDWISDASELVSGTEVACIWDESKWKVIAADACESAE